ncbi:MAG: sterol transfer family protein [Moraxellaceae bacterium]|jgi:putative sterol carrier protein|nr:sterol transfer family protein [Moraxellaceae bacterium]MDF3031825.1 sterol transfer family protein [Moraxellaceae bacterium]
MAAFLSDEWFAKVSELTAAAGNLNVPPALSGLALNLTATGSPAGNVDMCLNGGHFEKGHNASAPTKLTLPADLLRRIFLEGDASAGMQGFMSGQIKVEGDMSKLMALQSARPSAEQKELFKKVLEITG